MLIFVWDCSVITAIAFLYVVILLQDQCELDQPDKNGKTPLMLAMGRKHDHVIAYLKKEIANRKRLIPKVDLW